MVKRAHWNILSDCNLSCGFCYLWRRDGVDIFDPATSRQLISALSRHVQQLVIGGGDPLMREDIVELVIFAKSLGLHVELHTNAVRLREIDFDRLFAHLDRIGLSLDGDTPEAHDRMRAAPGNYAQCFDALELAERYGVSTTVRSLVTRRNLGQLSRLADQLRCFDVVRKWSLRQFAPLGRGAGSAKAFAIADDLFEHETSAIVAYARVAAPALNVQVISLDDMSDCYCLITEDGCFYSHPSDGDYRSAGKFPDLPVDQILERMTYDRSARP